MDHAGHDRRSRGPQGNPGVARGTRPCGRTAPRSCLVVLSPLRWREKGVAWGDLTDAEWELVGPLLPPERGRPGRPGHDNRPILDGILWRAREGARWRALPERYGKWNTVRRRFARWRGLGVLEAVFAALAESGAAGERVQMLDSTTIRAHQHAAGAKGGRTAKRWAARGVGSRPSCTCAATPAARRSPSSSPPARRTRPAPSRLWSRISPPGRAASSATWATTRTGSGRSCCCAASCR